MKKKHENMIRALELTRTLHRPAILTETTWLHDPNEIRGWDLAPLDQLGEEPDRFFFKSQLTFMTSEGYVYFLPMMLAFALSNLESDFAMTLVVDFLIERWLFVLYYPNSKYHELCGDLTFEMLMSSRSSFTDLKPGQINPVFDRWIVAQQLESLLGFTESEIRSIYSAYEYNVQHRVAYNSWNNDPFSASIFSLEPESMLPAIVALFASCAVREGGQWPTSKTRQ